MPINRLRCSLLYILCSICAIAALPALLIGLLLYSWADATQFDTKDRWQAVGSFALLGLLAYGLLWSVWHPLSSDVQLLFMALRLHAWMWALSAWCSLWLVNLLLAPLIALLAGAIVHVSLPSWLLRTANQPPTPLLKSASVSPDETLADDTHEETMAALSLPLGVATLSSPSPSSSLVVLETGVATTYYDGGYHAVSSAPAHVNRHAVIGQPLGGDLDWIEGGWFVFPESALCEHGVISGNSGSGKTSFVLRLASLARSVYGWRVYYLDAKADDETAVQFVTEMERIGTAVRVFPNEPMDGWRGSSSVLRNRLMQLLTYSESFYKDGARLLLGLALDAPGGIPHSSTDLLQRLDKDVLESLYKGTPKYGQLKRLDAKHLDGTMMRYESFFTSAQALLDGSWSWEDTPAAYIALDSLGQQDDTEALGRFLIEDFGHFVKHRKPKGEHALLIAEEFSALAASVDITNLFQRIRSSGGSVFVISQGDASLGRQADKLFQACANIIVFQGSDPDVLLQHAGTRLVPDFSHHRPTPPAPSSSSTPDATVGTGATTLRMKEVPKINANEVRRLDKGEGFWIFKGQVQKAKVEMLRQTAEALERIRQRILPLQPPPLPASPKRTPAARNPSTPAGVPTNPPVGPGTQEPEKQQQSGIKKKGRGLFDV